MWGLDKPDPGNLENNQLPRLGQKCHICFIFLRIEGLRGVYENIFSPDLHAVAIHTHGRVLADFARGYVVLPAMPWARHDVAVHNSLTEGPSPVETRIVNGTVLAANIRQGDRLALYLELPDRSWSNLIRLRSSRKRHQFFPLPFGC
jgi:hypothetical protein